MNAPRRILRSSAPRRQRGAILYVALILLILLSLLGIAGVQVASMQEKMSAAWRASNLSFQNAETQNRLREQAIAAAPASESPDDVHCMPFDAAEWAEQQLGSGEMTGVNVRDVSGCATVGGGSLRQGVVTTEERTDVQYQITAFATDEVVVTDEASSESIVDTIYIVP